MRHPEARLGVRLLTRTTRSVAPTEAGEQLFTRLSPHLLEIEQELAALRGMRDTPAGTRQKMFRITLANNINGFKRPVNASGRIK